MAHRLRTYPARFVLRHPLRTARNLVGNRPSRLAHAYLGELRGVEIGAAAYNDFFLSTINVDRSSTPLTQEHQLRFTGRRIPVDFVAEAGALPFPDRSHDFVLASHVLEHIPDPLGALKEWTRVARRFIFIVLPDPSNEYDRGQPLTTIEDLEHRHRAGLRTGEDRHWNIWDASSFCALCEHLGLQVVEVQQPDDKRGNGFSVVIDVSTGPGGREGLARSVRSG